MRGLAVIVAAAAVTTAAPAAAMDVGTFIAKGEALKARGVGAMFSKDFKLVQAVAREASAQYQAEKAARERDGRAPISCAPKGAKLGAMEFFNELKKIPLAERGMSMKDGVAWVSRRKFPCRA